MTGIKNISLSLCDLLGKEYTNAVCEANAALTGKDKDTLRAIADEKVEFYPESFRTRADELLGSVGRQICSGIENSNPGAGSSSFDAALHKEMAPLSGLGPIRVGENGKAYLAAKSEHYHASLGHFFPGYALIEKAKQIGICNVTHNNTRGHVTRLCEREIVRVANGLKKDQARELQQIIDSKGPLVLNRVINLETGSLAVEAALKMMLARFYRLDKTYDEPRYRGKIPVFLVMADHNGGKEANYHGTTILTQCLRGMWPDMSRLLEEKDILMVQSVAINDIAVFKAKVEKFDGGKYKIAGFFHELILMNYGGIRLTDEFVEQTHEICREHDIAVCVDEIQSCIWSPKLFLFREYPSTPSFVSVGKGFPGGEYPASKILTTSAMDSLNQFGALVTNGQEELASLAYLITIAFAEANAEHTKEIGRYYQQSLHALALEFPQKIVRIEGEGHLAAIVLSCEKDTIDFCRRLNGRCVDISAQTYKANCPPGALTKLPLISTRATVDFVIEEMKECLR